MGKRMRGLRVVRLGLTTAVALLWAWSPGLQAQPSSAPTAPASAAAPDAAAPSAAAPAASAAGQIEARRARPSVDAGPEVEVQGFEVEGNTLLPRERIDAALEPYRGRATLARLRAAAAMVQDLYRDAGYGGVVAFLPGQSAPGGVVRIRVV